MTLDAQAPHSAFIESMDKDLSSYSGFDKLSDRVGYWNRRLALLAHTDAEAKAFEEVVGNHSRRVMSLLRAG